MLPRIQALKDKGVEKIYYLQNKRVQSIDLIPLNYISISARNQVFSNALVTRDGHYPRTAEITEILKGLNNGTLVLVDEIKQNLYLRSLNDFRYSFFYIAPIRETDWQQQAYADLNELNFTISPSK